MCRGCAEPILVIAPIFVSHSDQLMNKLAAVLLVLSGLASLGACSKQEAGAPTAANTPPVATTEAPAPAPAAAATDDSAAADASSSAPVAESVSETDDAPATAAPETLNPGTQPMMRLGGPSNAAPTSAKFKEGPNYQKLVPAQPTSVAPGKIEVIEVFWYGCGHCFALDPKIEAWRAKGKPAYVEFLRVPAMWNDATRMHARVFYTAELLGKLEQLHTAIFNEIHIKGDMLNNVDKISAFFKANGVSKEEFDKAFSSFAVESKLQRADFLNRRYKIESVPSVIVNGKYKTDVGAAGGEEQLFSLIDELSASEHGG
jgi:thiol:disulfide interchange protein DsbA